MDSLIEKMSEYSRPEKSAAFNAALSAFRAKRNFAHGKMAAKTGLGSKYLNIVAGRQETYIEHVEAVEAVLSGFKQVFFANLFASEPGAALSVQMPANMAELNAIMKKIEERCAEITKEVTLQVEALASEIEKLKLEK